METKKTWEYVSLRAYPITQALALPPDKDKQLEACPRQSIYTHTLRPGQSLNDGMKEPRIYESTESFLRIYMQRACTLEGCTPYYIYKGE